MSSVSFFFSAAFERIMAVGILRVKGGLDYSSVLETVISMEEVETESQTFTGGNGKFRKNGGKR